MECIRRQSGRGAGECGEGETCHRKWCDQGRPPGESDLCEPSEGGGEHGCVGKEHSRRRGQQG